MTVERSVSKLAYIEVKLNNMEIYEFSDILEGLLTWRGLLSRAQNRGEVIPEFRTYLNEIFAENIRLSGLASKVQQDRELAEHEVSLRSRGQIA